MPSISLTSTGTAYTQNFDSLSNVAGSTTNALTIPGWSMTESGGGARDNEQYGVDTGGSNTGDTYSYGAAAGTDRALGELRSGTLIPIFGASFTNDTGTTISSLDVSFAGEEWRLGTAGRTDQLTFEYSLTAPDLVTGSWTGVSALNFVTPDTATTGAKNGNAAADRTALSATISGLNIAPGETFWIRWTDTDASGADDGLAIDDFSLTANAAPVGAGTFSVAAASSAENIASGFVDFVVSRTDGSAGAATVSYTVAAGTATAADFTGSVLPSGTVAFADGQTSATIHLPIFNDALVEGDEGFTMNLTGTTAGAIGTATAAGTIVDDDVPGIFNIAAGSAVENIASGFVDFVVSRTGGSAGAATVSYAVAAGTATAADFTGGVLPSGTVAFADGQTSATINVPIFNDALVEGDEGFTISLTGTTAGTIGTALAAGTIVDNDLPPVPTANVFINEFHYDNGGTDVGEAIEVAGVAGTNLTGYKLVLYNGTNTPNAAPVYTTTNLSGIIDDEGNGYGALSFSYPVNGIQNGAADGIALIAPDGTVMQFLSYSGTIIGAAGTPAGGVVSTDLGVSESPAPAAGFSLQLTGTGSSAPDFTWTVPSDDSFGSLNQGQSFLPAGGTSHIRIDDAHVVEGDSGTQNLIFTVHRAGGQSAAVSVAWSVNLDGTGDAADLGSGVALTGTVNFAVGEFSRQIIVPIAGDTVGESNETLHVTLGATTGDAVVDRAVATGTITNDDPLALVIGAIQGEGHQSAYVGQTVITTGIVTAVDSNGFYLQDGVGDGNGRTSDGIFVFTSSAPTVAAGDSLSVRGTVAEFAGDAAGLTVTEITAPTVAILSHGNPLPAAVLIGEHGILPPAETIDDDHLASYDPTHDGVDFWESLEGMRVTIETPQAVSITNEFGETDVVASLGHGATGMNDRGGITISPTANPGSPVDYNPEKIQIDDDSGLFAGFSPNYSIGDQLSNVTGIVNYSFDNYEVLVTEAVSSTKDLTLAQEQSALVGDANHLSLATFNVENLDASDHKFDILAGNIVYNLRAPDIVALQEIQDADGAGSGADLSGTFTAQGLIDAILVQSGLHYGYIEIAPTVANSTGGEPNGNIRNGFLYNMDRVSYIADSAELVTGPAYNGSRNPLVASFDFNGHIVTAIDVHATSRGGSDPLWGDPQPPADAGDAARTAQAAGVLAYVQDHLADDPGLNFALLGDWNGFYFEQAQSQITNTGLFTNLNTLLPEQERYSYVFEGNSQQIDNILVTGGLLAGALYDSVHLNAEFGGERATDHDPQLSLLLLAAAPTNLVLSHASVLENLAAGAVVGTLSATDTVGDRLTFALLNDAGGLFAVNGTTGVVTTTAAFNYEAVASYTIAASVTDAAGLSTSAGFAIAVTDVNEAPTAATDSLTVNEDATSGNIWSQLLANDQDPDFGDTLKIASVDTTGTLGHLIFDPASQGLRYVADNDLFDTLQAGQSTIDHFSYTVADANGLTSVATVNVTVTGVADGVTLYGTLRNDTLIGTDGEDQLFGLIGNDKLYGLGGNDTLTGGIGNTDLFGGDGNDLLRSGLGNDDLDGGAGNDRLLGGLGNDHLLGGEGDDYLAGDLGNDNMTGGAGRDQFAIGYLGGNDTITDFSKALDTLILATGLDVASYKVKDVNNDHIADLTLTLEFSGKITLLGVDSFQGVRIEHGAILG